jgi:two-component system OmpR family response regulator
VAQRILVVDDDPRICEVICFALEKAGFETVRARDGAAALKLFAAGATDFVVLDIGMPEIDGLEVCRRIRQSSEVPILFLSARDDEIDRILGLEIGADDYVIKPFSPRELVARVRAILKRANGAPPQDATKDTGPLVRGRLTLDQARHRAAFREAAVAFTAIEFAIMSALMKRPEFVLSRDQLMTQAYGGAIHVSDRTIDSHVRNIRTKLAAAGCADGIETVHGVGFRLGPCQGAAGAGP